MPKLAEGVIQENQGAIEAAALRLFIRQGYFGTSIRDIAAEAGVSIGNIYNYYSTKEALYESLVRRYLARMAKVQAKLKPLLGRFDAESLRQLAGAAREIVHDHADYWRLMYIDVTEFGNRHFAHAFRRLAKTLERQAGGYNGSGVRSPIDPALAYAAIYLQLFTYFLVEELFGGKRHLGRPESAAVEQLIDIFRSGIAAPAARSAGSVRGGDHEDQDALDSLDSGADRSARPPGSNPNHGDAEWDRNRPQRRRGGRREAHAR